MHKYKKCLGDHLNQLYIISMESAGRHTFSATAPCFKSLEIPSQYTKDIPSTF